MALGVEGKRADGQSVNPRLVRVIGFHAAAGNHPRPRFIGRRYRERHEDGVCEVSRAVRNRLRDGFDVVRRAESQERRFERQGRMERTFGVGISV